MVPSQGDSNRFVDEEAELYQQPIETTIIPRDWKDERPIGKHASSCVEKGVRLSGGVG